MNRLEELQEQHTLLEEELTKIKLLIKKEQIKIAKEKNRLYQIKKTCANNESEEKLIGLFICKETVEMYIDYLYGLNRDDNYEIAKTTIPVNWNEKDVIPAIL